MAQLEGADIRRKRARIAMLLMLIGSGAGTPWRVAAAVPEFVPVDEGSYGKIADGIYGKRRGGITDERRGGISDERRGGISNERRGGISNERRAVIHEELREAIESTLDAALDLESVHVPLHGEKWLEAGQDGRELSVTWPKAPRVGTQSVVIRGNPHEGDGEAKECFVNVRLSRAKEVLVSRRALLAGDIVRSGDLLRKRAPRTEGKRAVRRSFDEALVLDPRALIGRRVLRAVALDEIITEHAVELPPPSARGTAVKVVVERGALRISTDGVLERASRSGEEVSVRLSGARTLVRGRLLGSSVYVEESAR